jgi:glycosyltransferase involved in cell wall biosynthesis
LKRILFNSAVPRKKDRQRELGMRVAHFVQRYPPAPGGSEAYFARLSRYLAQQGEEVTLFTTTALDLEAFWSPKGKCLPPGTASEDGVQVVRYPLDWRFRGRRYLMKALSLWPQRLWQCLTLPCNPVSHAMWRDAGQAAANFDLVHASAFPYAWPIACGLRLARRLGVPFLLTPFLHLGDPEDPCDRTRRQYTTPALLSLIRAADLVFVQTALERAALVERGIDPARLVQLGMGVEPAECTSGNRQRVRQQWDVTDDTVVIGHLANNSIEKGTVDLVQAAEQARQSGHHFHLVLAGPQMPNFRRFWRAHGPDPRTTCLGWLTDEQRRDFFAGIDVFVLPSRSDSFGLVLLEAWANGIPNVAYRAGGPASVIRHAEDGLLVPCGDVAGLGEAIAQLVDDAKLRRQLGMTGLERTASEFRWPDKLATVRGTYREIIGGK